MKAPVRNTKVATPDNPAEAVEFVPSSRPELPQLEPRPVISINWTPADDEFEIVADLPGAASNACCELDQRAKQAIVTFNIRKRKPFVPPEENDELDDVDKHRYTVNIPRMQSDISWELCKGFIALSRSYKWPVKLCKNVSSIVERPDFSNKN